MTEAEAKVGQKGLWFFFEIMVLIHEELKQVASLQAIIIALIILHCIF